MATLAAPALATARTSLAESARVTQSRLATATGNAISSAFRSGFDPGNARSSWALVRPAVVSVVKQARNMSAAHAAQSYNQSRALGGLPPLKINTKAPISESYLSKSIDPQGLGRFLSGISDGMDDEEALDSAASSLSACGSGLTLDAGRNLIISTATNDPKASGWARATGNNPCDFCLMLAGRGAVYSQGSADFLAHDHCACTPYAVFGR